MLQTAQLQLMKVVRMHQMFWVAVTITQQPAIALLQLV
jgi:hypothetical protein